MNRGKWEEESTFAVPFLSSILQEGVATFLVLSPSFSSSLRGTRITPSKLIESRRRRRKKEKRESNEICPTQKTMERNVNQINAFLIDIFFQQSNEGHGEQLIANHITRRDIVKGGQFRSTAYGGITIIGRGFERWKVVCYRLLLSYRIGVSMEERSFGSRSVVA